jgi:transposase
VQLQAQIDEVDAKLTAWHRADECSRRLVKIPSIGPIGAVENEDPGSSSRALASRSWNAVERLSRRYAPQ